MRTFADDRRWMTEGTALFLGAVAALDDAGLAAACALPGWTRRHLVSHVAANADAIGNLVQWAATGVERPMYASPQERAAGIERGATMPAEELVSWLHRSVESLADAMDRLTDEQWAGEVRTAQGRTVPATETPWMRAREVCVHAVDLAVPSERGGLTFADLSDDFNRALSDDIRTKRGLAELPAAVARAPLPEVTAWLAGRPHTLADAPELGPWL